MKSYLQHAETLAGYTDVLETVKTLEKVSASALHDLKVQIGTATTYSKELAAVRRRLSAELRITRANSIPTTKRQLTVIVTGVLGLTGDLWERLRQVVSAQADMGKVLLVGRDLSGWETLFDDASTFTFVEALPTEEELVSLTAQIMCEKERFQYSHVFITHYTSEALSEQTVVTEQVYPTDTTEPTTEPLAETSGWPVIDGKGTELLQQIDTLYVQSALYIATLETIYTAHAARTLTLEHAAEKTKDLIEVEERTYRIVERKADTNQQLEQFAAQK